jgi:hypothetical protein
MFCWPGISMHPCNENQLDANLSSVYFVSQLLHVSGISVAHHQEVYCIYTTIGTCCVCLVDTQLKSKTRTNLLYMYSIPPDDGLQICPKHVEVDWRNKLRINLHQVGFNYMEEQIIFNKYNVHLLGKYIKLSTVCMELIKIGHSMLHVQMPFEIICLHFHGAVFK